MLLPSDHASPQYIEQINQLITDWELKESFEMKTSGSTGEPKMITHSKAAMTHSAQLTVDRFGLSEEDIFLVCLPVEFIAGMMMVVRAVTARAKVVAITPSANPLRYLDRTIDFAALTPLQLEHAFAYNPERIGLIKQIIIGGAPISKKLLVLIQSCKFETLFYHTYGMTETITHIAIRELQKSGYSDEFESLRGISLSLTDDNRLIIKGEHLTQSPIVTNDIVETTGTSSFRWIERADNVINSGGLKIYPAALEEQIDHLFDGEFFLTGLADETLGQKLVLVMVDQNDQVDQQDLIVRLKAMLPKNHVPKEIRKVDALLKTATGKVIKDLGRYK